MGPSTRLGLRLRLGLSGRRPGSSVLGGVELLIEVHLCIQVQEHVVLVDADKWREDLAISDPLKVWKTDTSQRIALWALLAQ